MLANALTCPPISDKLQSMPVWRNGRRTGLKIPRWQHRVGSKPTTGTRNTEPRKALFYKGFSGFVIGVVGTDSICIGGLAILSVYVTI